MRTKLESAVPGVHESWVPFMAELSQAATVHPSIAGAADPQLSPEIPVAPDDTDEMFVAYANDLSGQATAAVHKPVQPQSIAPALEQTRWILVEVPDGEWPVTRVFTNPTNLAKRIGQLDGKDVTALAFYGVPVMFTQGPVRYLLTPAGDAVPIPLHAHATVGEVRRTSELDTAIQTDGYLGAKELAHISPAVVVSQAASVDDDDD